MNRFRHLRAVLALVLSLGTTDAAHAVSCTVNNLCPAGSGPCTLTANLTCDSPASIDLGGRALVVGSGKVLRATAGDEGGALLITGAASVTLESNAQIRGEAGPDFSGEVILVSDGPVTLTAGSRIVVSADPDGGYIEVLARSGNLDAGGTMDAAAKTNGEGGEVVLVAEAGTVTVGGGGINTAATGDDSGGGSVSLDAGSDIQIQARIDVRGGDAGELFATSTGSISTTAAGDIDADGRAGGGFGGSVALLAGTAMNLAGDITATAPGNETVGGGLGGELLLSTDAGSMDVGGELDFSGSGPDGEGGIVELSAGFDLTLAAPLLARVNGGGFGGAVALSARNRVAVASLVDVHANDAGGIVSILADGTLTVQDKILADGSGPSGFGGRTQLRACTLEVVIQGEVSATGSGIYPAASNRLQASGAMHISGTLSAGNRNLLEYLDTPPTFGSGAIIQPEEEIVQNPGLPCCDDSCSPTTTTTTVPSPTTTMGTSSTTTSGPTTTLIATTTIASNTTTSTTLSGPGSTTTAPAASSTTTTSSATGSTSTSTPPTVPSTTPTTPLFPTTTSTLPPPTCVEQATNELEVADCQLDDLAETLDALPPDTLGGAKTAKLLSTRLSQVRRLLTTARSKAKPDPTLRKAKRQLQSFRALVKRRRNIASEVADMLRTLASELSAAIERARTAARAGGG